MKTFFAKLLGISAPVLNFFLPFFRSQVASSLERLLPLALNTVTELATSDLKGSEKQQIALKRLEEAAKAEGIIAATSLLNFSIEAAVVNLKAKNQSI